MCYNKKFAKEIADEIKQAGFRPFLAERGTYGFYTDAEGTRVVCFSVDLGVPKVSGNYITSNPSSCGSGWGLGEYFTDKIADYFNAYPPSWAVGPATWRYATLADHLKRYQDSSKYTEVV